MTKILLAALLCILSACHTPQLGYIRIESMTSEKAHIVADIARPGAQVAFWCEEHKEYHTNGSAVYLGVSGRHALFVTAAHVVSGDQKRQVTPSLGGEGVEVDVIVRDDKTDVAILAAKAGSASAWTPAKLAPSGDYEFQRCMTYGHPLGLRRGHLTEGWVSARPFKDRYQVSAPSFFGNSGGGVYVFVDQYWLLLGISLQLRGTHDGEHIAPHVAFISTTEAIQAARKLAEEVLSAEVK